MTSAPFGPEDRSIVHHDRDITHAFLIVDALCDALDAYAEETGGRRRRVLIVDVDMYVVTAPGLYTLQNEAAARRIELRWRNVVAHKLSRPAFCALMAGACDDDRSSTADLDPIPRDAAGCLLARRDGFRHHHKLICFSTLDGEPILAVSGSLNLTRPGLTHNSEAYSLMRRHPSSRDSALYETFSRCSDLDQIPSSLAVEWTESMAMGPPYDLDTRDERYLRLDPHKLHAYQESRVQQVLDRFDDQPGYIELPTGAGKTVMATELIHRLLEDPRSGVRRVLWVCHNKWTLLQAEASFARQGASAVRHEHGWHTTFDEAPSGPPELTVQARVRPDSPECRVVFSTLQLINRTPFDRFDLGGFDLVVIDECHHVRAGKSGWSLARKRLKAIPHRIGLTATPEPERGQRASWFWPGGRLHNPIDKTELEDEEILARVSKASQRVDPAGTIRLPGKGSATQSFDNERLISNSFAEFQTPGELGRYERFVSKTLTPRLAGGAGHIRRVLVFACTIEHAQQLTKRTLAVMHRRGITGGADYIASDRRPRENRRAVDAFKTGDESTPTTQVLVTVGMALEGFDAPQIDAMVIVRPTSSRRIMSQMLGRGLRGPAVGGTEEVEIYDFAWQLLDEDGHLIHTVGYDDV